MKLPSIRRLDGRGFAHHFILPVIAILLVGTIGAWVFKHTHAATTPTSYYSSSCTKTTYGAPNSKFQPCALYAQELLNGIQHQKRSAVLKLTAYGGSTFKYGNMYYLLMNGLYGKYTAAAVTSITGNKNGQLTSGTTGSWQALCTEAKKDGLASGGPAGSATLVFNKADTSNTKKENATQTNAGVFTNACGTLVKTGTSGSASGSTGSTSGTSGNTGSGNGSTATGFITTSGTKLMLGGQQYKSLSFNFSPVGACWSSNWSTSQMDTFFAAIPKGSLARFFAPPDNTDSAAFVESIVKEADKYGDHLIIALADAGVHKNCDTQDSAGNGKTAAYYTDAVKPGGTYANWVQSVVKPLANDPGVAIWEIVNEPWHGGATFSQAGGVAGATTYVNAAATLIRNAERAGSTTGQPRQLISLAPADIGETGGVSGMESIFKNLDVIDDHDYSADQGGINQVTNAEYPQLQQIAKALIKPFMVDETGVEAGSCSSGVQGAWDNGSGGVSLASRAPFLTQKANAYLSSAGGASADVIWLYTGSGGGCSYENISPSDPIMAAVRSYKMP